MGFVLVSMGLKLEKRDLGALRRGISSVGGD